MMWSWCELMIKNMFVQLSEMSVNSHSDGMLRSGTPDKMWWKWHLTFMIFPSKTQSLIVMTAWQTNGSPWTFDKISALNSTKVE